MTALTRVNNCNPAHRRCFGGGALQRGKRQHMYVFTKKFWADLRNDPRETIDALKNRRSKVCLPLVQFCVFWRIVFSEYSRNHCLTRASALAFALLLTLIPLVVTAAFMLASLVEVHPHQVEKFFSVLLPFAPQTVLNYISTFFFNAQSLRGWGIGLLVIVAVGLFGAVEESFNTIWKVVRARSFFMRLRAFTMVLVYIPILIFLSFRVRGSGWLSVVSDYFFPIDILPLLLMVLAFTSLIWFVPNTRVRFSSAFLGGLVAGVLFELERRGFGTYVQLSIQTQTIYGTFGILVLFLISLFVVSLFVLFGAQAAYVHQHFRPLLRAAKRWDRRVDDYKTYLSFRMFIDAAGAFLYKREPPDLYYFVAKYELTDPQAMGILNWLVHANFLHRTSDRGGYVPTRDFSNVSLLDVLDEIRAQDLHVPPIPDDYTREFVASLLNNSIRGSRSPAEQISMGDMIRNLEESEGRFSNLSPHS